MTTGRVGMSGHAPIVKVEYKNKPPVNPEREKYQKVWQFEQYRKYAPGEQLAKKFLDVVQPEPDSDVIDFGCGTCRGSILIALLGRCNMKMVDFAPNCIDAEMQQAINAQKRLTFIEHDLTQPLDLKAEYGYCTDVMEHIPEQDVQKVLTNILKSAKKCFFQISTEPDAFGALIGEKLHMTVKPFEWWVDELRKLGCYFYYVEREPNCAIFYVTGWATIKDVMLNSHVNSDIETIISNVKTNINRGFKQIEPHGPSNRELMLLAGGPSLNDFTDDIIRQRKEGMALITVNNTYNWALEHGLNPSAQVVVDAREFNARFIPKVVDKCQYLIDSQCHPSMFNGLPEEAVWLWHSNAYPETKKILDEHYGVWYPILGGCTVTLRAIVLLRTLGWKHMHIYGLDSCLREDEHHAYAQPENDGEYLVNVTHNGKTFTCAQWMAMQAEEFREMASFFGNELQLAVYGDGLIASMIKDASTMEEQ